ncbi:MAG TPA: transglycosylase SLT domain-containing protein [Pyrinomonadaceae bacterium]|nr:transglycosylase SLT domain-containing protein [Pyrinomonadaceae bacterium]
MKKLPPLCALLLFSCLTAAAQQPANGYRFDNFDVPGGVRVRQPEPAPAVRPRKALKLTARTVVPASNQNATAPASQTAANSAAAYQPFDLPASLSSPSQLAASTPPATVNKVLDGFTTGDALIDRFIVDSGTRNGVDPVLIYSIMHRESSFKRNALSPKGARGLMQLMPGTAARFGVRNIFDPQQNIEGGARYMRLLLDMFDGDVRLALAGYNAGEGAVLKYGRRVPPYAETQEYVRRISERYELMRDPSTARLAPRVSRTQIAKLKSAEPPPLVYETSVFAVRTPDGKLRLVSQ